MNRSPVPETVFDRLDAWSERRREEMDEFVNELREEWPELFEDKRVSEAFLCVRYGYQEFCKQLLRVQGVKVD